MFGTSLPLASAEVGDLIGVFYSGAYGYSASNLGFLSHPTPAEVMVSGGEAHLLRTGGRPEDVLAAQQGIPAAQQ
jgi:diaminopimelate decarboxylase